MKRYIYGLILTAALAGLSVSCTVEGTTEANAARKKYLEAWMEVNHPGVNPTGLGIYIIDDIPGTGAAWTEENPCVMVNYTVRSLDGTITTTNDIKLNKQLGTYDPAASYEPVVWSIGEGTSYIGIDEMLKGMKVGGTRTAVIPSWLITFYRYDKDATYYKTSVDVSHVIYTITLKDMTSDIRKYCLDKLDSYVHKEIDSQLDSSYYNNADGSRLGFYFKSWEQPLDSVIPSGSKGHLWYITRRLDGQVVDTNIADTAKVYGIWDPSRSYTTVDITFASEYTDIQFDGSSAITGFQAAMFRMHAREKATTVFYYGLGYGGTAKDRIPAYSSLRFDLEFVDID